MANKVKQRKSRECEICKAPTTSEYAKYCLEHRYEGNKRKAKPKPKPCKICGKPRKSYTASYCEKCSERRKKEVSRKATEKWQKNNPEKVKENNRRVKRRREATEEQKKKWRKARWQRYKEKMKHMSEEELANEIEKRREANRKHRDDNREKINERKREARRRKRIMKEASKDAGKWMEAKEKEMKECKKLKIKAMTLPCKSCPYKCSERTEEEEKILW